MSEILPAVQTAVAEITAVVDGRHEKYGSGNIANSPGGPLNGLRVRLHDKLARLNNYVDNGGAADFTDDKLRDCFIDIAGYALIGLLVLDGAWPELPALTVKDTPRQNPAPELEPMGGECQPLATFKNTPPHHWDNHLHRYVNDPLGTR